MDGYITKEGLDPEILDFFSGEEFKKNAYRIVYPPEKAKFDLEIKNGKRAISLGAFKEGAILFNKMPLHIKLKNNSNAQIKLYTLYYTSFF